jgi:hypothetical protein
MLKITNQQLYSDIQSELSNTELTENSAELFYSATKESLSVQEEFSEELIEKCASIGFDAVNDLYQAQNNIEIQSEYSDGIVEDLFCTEDQDIYANWISHGANIVKSGAKAIGAAFKSRTSYAKDMSKSALGRQAYDRHGNSIFGRMAGTYEASRRQFKKDDKANKKKADDIIEDSRHKAKQETKGFFGKFKDDKTGFMGHKAGFGGMKKWAGQNKLQAATAAAAGTAAVAGGSYLAYKAYKRRQAQKQAQSQQGLNQTHQVQPTI